MLMLAAARAAGAGPGCDPARIRAAVWEFPPYAHKGTDGAWSGDAVELFGATARDAGVEVELVETDPGDLLRLIDKGTLDAAAMPTIASDRALGVVVLTSDWGRSELHIATRTEGGAAQEVSLLARSLFGARQWRVYGSLLVAIVIFALIVWHFERGRNTNFEGRRGLGVSVWWSVATLSTVGYGDAVPHTALGRLFAGTWMLISLVLVALFTATVTSALATADASVRVHGAFDLPIARVGILADGPARVYFEEHFLPHVSYPTVLDATRSLARGELDAVVADQAVLRAALDTIATEMPNGIPLRILPPAIDARGFAFGLRRSLPADLIRSFDAALDARIAQTATRKPT